MPAPAVPMARALRVMSFPEAASSTAAEDAPDWVISPSAADAVRVMDPALKPSLLPVVVIAILPALAVIVKSAALPTATRSIYPLSARVTVPAVFIVSARAFS